MRILPIARLAMIAAAAGLALAGCKDVDLTAKHMQPLSRATKQLIERKGMEAGAPIFIRIFKEESALEVWKQEKASGRFALLKAYDICAWSGVLGPKLKEGDKQAPEGFYTVTPAQMNPNSSYYLSFNLGFPNSFDRAHGRTGAHLMVHGACSSAGCYAMEDEQIAEIYALGREAFIGGQRAFQVQAFPFRMTPENMARHRDSPNKGFWRMLKEGYDHFEVARMPPKVDVCSGRYVFNAEPQSGGRLSATEACPELHVPEAIRVAVEDKTARDEAKFALIAARLDAEAEAARAVAATESGPMTPIPASMLAAAPEPPMSLPRAAEAPAGEAGPDGVTASAYAPEGPDARDRGLIGRLLKSLW